MNSFLKLIPQKYQIYILPTLIVFGMIFVSFYVLVPKIQGIFDLRGELDRQQEQLAKLKKKRSLLESFDRTQIASELQIAEGALPEEKDVASILIAMENLSQSSQQGIDGLSLSPGIVSTESGRASTRSVKPTAKAVNPNDVLVRKGINAVEVNVRTKGSKTQFRQFLEQLLTSRRLFDIESVLITAFPDTPDFVSAEFRLAAYYLPGITQIGNIESPISEITDREKELLSQLAGFPQVSAMIADTNTQNSLIGQVGKSDLFSP